jgi:hypothetical protein
MISTRTPSKALSPAMLLESAAVQLIAVVMAVALGVALHWSNDGLWYRGDSARHAATGLFFWDLLTESPTRPIEYALSYYARYPVIVPGAYLPLFHVIEGVAFSILGPSPYVAKGLVWAFAALAGVYVTLWGRRFVAPWAGWAGAFTLLLPGFVRYSNAVMLNVPATALGVAGLYHLQRWLDEGGRRQQWLALGLGVATVVMYFPAAVVLLVAATWVILSARRVSGWLLWLPAAVMLAGLIVSAYVVPGLMARTGPSVARVFSIAPWAYYAHELLYVFGVVWPVMGVSGLVFALLRGGHRANAVRLVTAAGATMVGLAAVPASEDRYALLMGPLCVLAACAGVVALADASGRWRQVVYAGALASMLAVGTADALRTPVPRVAGFDSVARYLAEHGPSDAVLYSGGGHNGVFTFYVRALDPGFNRRVVLSNKILYRYALGADFRWTETPFVQSADEVAPLIQTQSGCRWIVVEVLSDERLAPTERLLRQALAGPEFEHVASFPVSTTSVTRLDLYRVRGPVQPVHAVDLSFPSFSSQVFRGVTLVERRR